MPDNERGISDRHEVAAVSAADVSRRGAWLRHVCPLRGDLSRRRPPDQPKAAPTRTDPGPHRTLKVDPPAARTKSFAAQSERRSKLRHSRRSLALVRV